MHPLNIYASGNNVAGAIAVNVLSTGESGHYLFRPQRWLSMNLNDAASGADALAGQYIIHKSYAQSRENRKTKNKQELFSIRFYE